MIGKLRGILDARNEDSAIIDVGGVGYLVSCSSHSLRAISQNPRHVTLYIETHVREDNIQLFGFASQTEKAAFLALTRINGVGNKHAIAILSVLTPSQIVTAILSGDSRAITQANGIGPKLASRIINELKDKCDSITSASSAHYPVNSHATSAETASHAPADGSYKAPPAENELASLPHDAEQEVINALSSEAQNLQDAITALVQLGYSREKASDAIRNVASKDPHLPLSELIRHGLKEMV